MKETVPNETSCGRRISSADRQAREFRAFLTNYFVRPIDLLGLVTSSAHHSGDEHFSRLATEDKALRYPSPIIIKDEKRWMVHAFDHYFGIDALQLGLDYSIKISGDDCRIIPYIHFAGKNNKWLHPDDLTFCQQHNIMNVEFYTVTKDQMSQLRTLVREAK